MGGAQGNGGGGEHGRNDREPNQGNAGSGGNKQIHKKAAVDESKKTAEKVARPQPTRKRNLSMPLVPPTSAVIYNVALLLILDVFAFWSSAISSSVYTIRICSRTCEESFLEGRAEVNDEVRLFGSCLTDPRPGWGTVDEPRAARANTVVRYKTD